MRPLAPPMTSPQAPRVVVIGGGITGLAAAHAIHRARPDVELTILEARDRPGGNILTEREGGFLVDAGPDSFIRTKPEALDLCRELGLEAELIPTSPAARHVFVAHRGRLEPLPGGMALAVPTRIEPLLRTPLLSLRSKLRVLAEPFVPASHSDADESIEAFFARRIGKEAARSIAGPLLGGIYAGDPAHLGIGATFPQLVELEQKYGSLLRGLLAQELARAGGSGEGPRLRALFAWLRRGGEAQAASPFLALRGGMGSLVDALVRALPDGTLRTGAPVLAVVRDGVRWRVETSAERIVADAVIVAAPAHVAARVVPDAELARELSGIPYTSTATVFFGLERARVAHDLRGFGFIVPPGEAHILAGTWVSSKWEARAPAGGALVRAFIGGSRDPDRVTGSSDAELVELARRELERLMGSLGPPSFTRVYRYHESSPQPLVGHGARLERIRTRLRGLPRLHVAGAGYDGVGIPDCVRQARAAASQVVAELAGAVRTLVRDATASR